MFGRKLVSDSLLAAVKEVTSGEQIDSSGSELFVGDAVRVQEGPHSGMTGTISGFKNTGTSEVQLDRGSHVSINNGVLLNEDINKSPDAYRADLAKTVPAGQPYSKTDAAYKRRKANKKNGNGNDEKVEINPEVQEAQRNSKIINMIKNSVRYQRGLIENENDPKEVGSTEGARLYKDMTPGQSDSELPPEALDYEKYNVNNPIVPNDEVDAILDKGSYFK